MCCDAAVPLLTCGNGSLRCVSRVFLSQVDRTEFRVGPDAATLDAWGRSERWRCERSMSRGLAVWRLWLPIWRVWSLRGPVHGMVELPLPLFSSSPDRSFDLDKRFTRRGLYQTVLREASRPHDLTGYMVRDTLIGLRPWEELHPVLRHRRIRGRLMAVSELHGQVAGVALAATSTELIAARGRKDCGGGHDADAGWLGPGR